MRTVDEDVFAWAPVHSEAQEPCAAVGDDKAIADEKVCISDDTGMGISCPYDFDALTELGVSIGVGNADIVANGIDDFADEFMALTGSADDDAGFGGHVYDPSILDDPSGFLVSPLSPDPIAPAATTSAPADVAASPCPGVTAAHPGEADAAAAARSSSQELGSVPSDDCGISAADTPETTVSINCQAQATDDVSGVIAADVPGAIAADIPGAIAADVPGAIAADIPGAIAADIPGATTCDDHGAGTAGNDEGSKRPAAEERGEVRGRQEKLALYLAKRKRRNQTKVSVYKSRQTVAKARPRRKGRFLPIETEFVPLAELQRRKRALMKEMQDRANSPSVHSGMDAQETASAVTSAPMHDDEWAEVSV